MNKYEMMFIVKTTETEENAVKVAEDLKSIITSMKGEITDSKDMGQKKLAYPINNQVRGNYYVLNVEATSAAVKEFDRKAKIDENILRHIVIKEEE